MALDPSDPQAVREAAREILSQPEFARHKLTLWRQFLDYVSHPGTALEDLVSWITGQFTGSGIGTVVAWVCVAVALIAVIAIVVLLTRSTSRDRANPFGIAPIIKDRTSAEFIADAERFESEGNWREALRARYTAVIVELGSRGTVRIRPGKTTGEYLAEVRSNWPDAAVHFAKVTELFEWAWYGDAKLSQSDIELFKQRADSVFARRASR